MHLTGSLRTKLHSGTKGRCPAQPSGLRGLAIQVLSTRGFARRSLPLNHGGIAFF